MKMLRFKGGPQGVIHIAAESRSMVVSEGQTVEFNDAMAEELLKTDSWEQVQLTPVVPPEVPAKPPKTGAGGSVQVSEK